MKALLPILCLALLVGCSSRSHETPTIAESLVASLTNDDVKWDGNFLGLSPTIEGDSAKRLLGLGKTAVPALREALSDENKFVAAHVLLTHILKKEHEFSATHWNGLKIDLHANGTVDLHFDQIENIKAIWKEQSGS